ncbi:alanine racemase [Fictibacillus enclensis]|uniref:Alanine racemase n=1 Tax=Fictibacillus enclensis TaxID=1017270 RepID=A0A0V8IRG4_9BACL|nr:alanine racemase [Fictibacillus enclensis]KSU77384.1 alanine racemase [Fictibacillus enclensis]
MGRIGLDTEEFYRDTWAEIDLSCIEENIRSFRRLLPDTTEIMAVVKANGYGHGAVPVAKTALEAGATYLAVALLDEALSLRQQGIKAPILVLGRTRPEDAVLAAKYNIALTVFQASWAREASAHLQDGQPVALHLKVDTGMGRIGTRDKEETQELVLTIEKYPSLQLEGVFTHFATADELESPLVEQQFERFSESLAWLKELGAVPRYIHCGNSAASLRFPKQIFNIARIGISMYGLAPSGELKNVLPFPLKEAFTLNTRLVHVKKVQPGDTVSYGATYTATEEEWIGTLPVGYADGWQRRYANQGHAIAGGIKVPFVGRICMDQCMVRLPFEMKVGDLVTLIGEQGSEKISMDDVALQNDTINYEIPCLITSRVPRIYKKQGRILEKVNVILNF